VRRTADEERRCQANRACPCGEAGVEPREGVIGRRRQLGPMMREVFRGVASTKDFLFESRAFNAARLHGSLRR